MADNLTLKVTLRGDGRQLSGTLQNAQGEVREFGSTSDRAGRQASGAFDRTGRSVQGVNRDVTELNRVSDLARNALLGLGGALGVREVIGLADAWTNAENQLRQATDSSAQLAAMQQRVVDLSIETRSSFDSTATLYSRLARSTTELGLTQTDLIGLVRTINQSFALSGATAAEASGAIFQLSQALASGTLRGEEFNSVSEQAPILMRAIEDSLNMTTGELREFAATGGITAEMLVSALQSAANSIDTAFGESIASFSQKMTTARTKLIAWVGTSDEVSGSVDLLGDSIVWVTEHLDGLLKVGGIAASLFAGYLAKSMATYVAGAIAANAATLTLTGSMRALRAVMATAFGPVGLVVAAAGILFTFREELGLTGDEAYQTRIDVDGLAESFRGLTDAQQENTRASLVADLIDMRMEAAKLGTELNQVAEIVRNSGQLTAQGGALPIASPEDIAHGRELRAQLGGLLADINAGSGLLNEYDAAMQDTAASTSETASQTQALASANDDLDTSYQSLLDTLYPLQKSQREYAEDKALLTEYALRENKSAGWLEESYARLDKQYQNSSDAAKEYSLTGEQAANRVADAAGPMADAWQEATRRIDETFADAFAGAFDSFDDFSDQLLDGFKRLLAELAYQATLKPIVVQLTGAIGGVMGVSGAATAGQAGDMGDGSMLSLPGFGSPSTLWSMGQAAYSGYMGTYGAALGVQGGLSGTAIGSANAVVNGTGVTGAFNTATGSFGGVGAGAMTGIYSAGAGIAGGWAGNHAGEAVFDKHANSNYGQMAGAAIGTYILPVIGTAIGSFVGSLLDVAFGSGREYGFRFTQREIDPSVSDKALGYDASHGDGTPWYSSGDYADGDLGRGRTTAFGSYGFLSKEIVEPADMIKFLDAMEKIDNTLAAVMDADQLERIKESLHGYYYFGDSMQEVMRERMDVIVEESNSAFESAIEQMGGDIEGQVEALANGLQIENVGERMAAAVAEDMNAEFRDALGSGSDLNAATQAILASAQAVTLLGSGVDRLNLQFDASADGALDAADALQQAAGGIEAFAAQQSAYYQAMYSDAERLSRYAADLRSTLASLGVQVPHTVAGYRELVEAQDLNSAAGGRLYVALQRLAPAFAETLSALEQAIAQGYQDSLGRAPDAGGLAYWMNQVAGGALTLEQALEAIADSAEAARGGAQGLQLQLELLRLQGRESEALALSRAAELRSMDASYQGMQLRIWALADEQAAVQEAAQAQEQYNQALAGARSYLDGVFDSLTGYIDQLQGTDAGLASPGDQLAASSAAFREQYQLALAGDREALSGITQYADRFIQAQQGWSGSGGQTQDVIQSIIAKLETLPDQLSPEQFLAEEFRDAIDGQTGELVSQFADLKSRLTREFATLDLTGEGLVDWSEFREAFDGVVDNATLRQIFAALDNNGSGAIDELEAISSGTQSLVDMWAGMQPESVQDAIASITGMYESALNREPDLPGLQYWITEWLNGSSLADIRHSIEQHVGDDPATNSSGGAGGAATPDATQPPPVSTPDPTAPPVASAVDQWLQGQSDRVQGWASAIDVMYDQLFDRDPDLAGLRYWIDDLQSGQSLADVERSLHAAAGGNAYASGGVFTNSIVNEPTWFNESVMGEAGPEAIMPLIRHANGSLGIRAELPPIPAMPLRGGDDIAQILRELKREVAQLRAENRQLLEEGNRHGAAAVNVAAAGHKRQLEAQERSAKSLETMERKARLESMK